MVNGNGFLQFMDDCQICGNDGQSVCLEENRDQQTMCTVGSLNIFKQSKGHFAKKNILSYTHAPRKADTPSLEANDLAMGYRSQKGTAANLQTVLNPPVPGLCGGRGPNC